MEPIVKVTWADGRTIDPKSCADIRLSRAYICRRALTNTPFMFDYLAHSAELFDVYTQEDAKALNVKPTAWSNFQPTTRFMFERFEDRQEGGNGPFRPYFEIRQVDIGQPYLKWLQNPLGPGPERRHLKPVRWYHLDKRRYETFALDGCEWTKQLCGNAVSLTLAELAELARRHGQRAYDIATNTCHDARESVMRDLGVVEPEPRLATRAIDGMRPVLHGLKVGSGSASEWSRGASTGHNSVLDTPAHPREDCLL